MAVAGAPIDLELVDIPASNGVIHFLDFIVLDVPDYDIVGTLENVPADTGFTFNALLLAAETVGLIAEGASG